MIGDFLRAVVILVVGFFVCVFLSRHTKVGSLGKVLPSMNWQMPGQWSRCSVGCMSLLTPCQLRPVPISEEYAKEQGAAFASDTIVGGLYSECYVIVQHVTLAQGRDAYALYRELKAKISSEQKRTGGYPLSQKEVLISNCRGEQMIWSFPEKGVQKRMNRLTIAKNREAWMVMVVSSDGNTANAEIFEKILNSIRL